MVELDGEMIEQLLAAIHDNGAKLDDALDRIKNIEGTLGLLTAAQQAQGTELENVKQACNKRASHCSAAFHSIRNEISGNGRDSGG